MIRINMTRQDTNHPDKRLRHHGRAWCEVGDQHFEAEGPAPIYKLTTLLRLHGHGGEKFEVWDDLSPFGNPGGLAMTGRVRNWARLINGKPKFDQKAAREPDFTPAERNVVAEAAGRVTGSPQRVPSSGDKARTKPFPLRDVSEPIRKSKEAPAGVVTTQSPEAA
jgi:hypothetical protein